MSPALIALAHAAGIQTGYSNPWGERVEVPEDTLRALLGALGLPAGDDAQAGDTLRALQARPVLVPEVCVARAGAPLRVPLGGAVSGRGQWQLTLEDGRERAGSFAGDALSKTQAGPILELGVLAHGYHRLDVRVGTRRGSAHVIVAPARCYLPPALALGERTWGFTVQLYGLRGATDAGLGDFTALAELAQASAALGAGIVGVNPLHALFPDRPAQASPYAPSSRTALNVLYVDPCAVPEYASSAPAQALLAGAQANGTLERLRAGAHVDYAGVARLRLAAFEHLYDAFEATELRPGSARAAQFHAFGQGEGESLARFGVFEALREHHGADGRPDWRQWPADHRDARSPAVARFAHEHARRVSFHHYLQWLADCQLGDAARHARAGAMPVGLYRDLAVGVDRAGAQVWSAPGLYAQGFGTGAPPDAWNLNGQCWGFPPPLPGRSRALGHQPFAAELRANMRHAGALRMDHVLGLARLFWVPDGALATHGGYVRYPLDELLAVLALESHRARCMVVGEDLGTVPDGLRETLAREAVLSTRLFYFERDREGGFATPAHYPELAAVGISTHDLPPLAGWLSGHDQQLKRALELYPTAELRARDEAGRAADLERIAALAAAAGVAADAPAPRVAQLVYAHLAATPALLCLVQPEDVLGVQAPVNLPGTSTEHANWTLRLPASVAQLAQAARPLAQAIAAQRPPPVAPAVPAVPRATYRVQLHAGFTFYDAAREVPYLAALGVSHLYTSPITRARAGSTHGYDVADFGTLNPELGGEAGFAALLAATRRHGLGMVVDHVPNHMGVGQADNPWWLDVLEWGRASPHAPAFDIDWEPAKPELRGRVLVPFLGDHYGAALESGALELRLDPREGSISLWYGPHRFPLRPASYRPLLARAAARAQADPALAAGLRDLVSAARAAAASDAGAAREAGMALKATLARLCLDQPAARAALEQALHAFASPDTAGRARLHRLIEHQHYRPAFWRVAADEINYRRFFQINELAGIRQEHPPVFTATHARVLALLHAGAIHGLRIDHVDGLYDPAGYLEQLARAAGPVVAGRPWLWVEKILAAHEALPGTWPVAGTTGYELIAQVTGVQVDGAGLAALTRLYRRYTGDARGFEAIAHAARHEVMEEELGGELEVLATLADRLAEQNWTSRDYTRAAMVRALREIVAGFPVYRTYVSEHGAGVTDREHLDWAVGVARRNRRLAQTGIFDFLRATLAPEPPTDTTRREPHALARTLAMKFQQYTAPVTAKAVEDTAFYRYVPLLAVNEVGADPARGAMLPDAFHRALAARGQAYPHALNPVATHDTKRSADVRARLAVLAEDPRGWARLLSRVTRRAGPARRAAGPEVTRHDEWYLYQTVIGSWPGAPDTVDWDGYRARLVAHLIKAMRESGERTSWTGPDEAYEAALGRYIRRALDPQRSRPLLETLARFMASIGRAGTVNALAQSLLALTVPGIPDLYQGSEGEHLALVDPDNRRPVDFAALAAALAQPVSDLGTVLDDPGRAKLHLVRRALALRARRPDDFAGGAYTPLPVTGMHAARVLAFRRGDGVVVVVPRLVLALTQGGARWPVGEVWADTAIALPAQRTWRDVFTGRTLPGGGTLLAAVLTQFPLALFEAADPEQQA